MSRFLFRALRENEIRAGNILVPKAQGEFVAEPRLDVDTRLDEVVLVRTREYAVRQHQWQQNGFPTSGISATPHIDRAKYYCQHGVIVKIDRYLLPGHGIQEFFVKEWLGKHPEDIANSNDDEVILVSETGRFPSHIIVEIVQTRY